MNFYAAMTVQPRLIIDCATLTGASAVSVGKKMAAMMSNCGEVEEYAITRSRYIGDVVFPIPYAPELHKNELYSTVADMKNSVKDRSNAQKHRWAIYSQSSTRNSTQMASYRYVGPSKVKEGLLVLV